MYACRPFQTITSATQSNSLFIFIFIFNDYVLALDMACDWLQQINLMYFYGNVHFYTNKPKTVLREAKTLLFQFYYNCNHDFTFVISANSACVTVRWRDLGSYFAPTRWESSCDVVTRVFVVLSSRVCADVVPPACWWSPGDNDKPPCVSNITCHTQQLTSSRVDDLLVTTRDKPSCVSNITCHTQQLTSSRSSQHHQSC